MEIYVEAGRVTVDAGRVDAARVVTIVDAGCVNVSRGRVVIWVDVT